MPNLQDSEEGPRVLQMPLALEQPTRLHQCKPRVGLDLDTVFENLQPSPQKTKKQATRLLGGRFGYF